MFAQTRIASVLPFDRNLILVFTAQDGIYLYDGQEVQPFQVEKGSELEQLVINQAVMLKDGTFAIGTQDNGLYLMNKQGKLLLHLSRREGLFDNTIHTLYQDEHENLWLGLNNGISLVELSSPFSRIDGTKGVSGAGYAALVSNNQLYLGTNSGLFASQMNSASHSFSLVPNSTGQVYQLRANKKRLLVGHHNGPYTVADNRASKIFSGQGAWDFVEIPSKPGYFILGSYDGISLLQEVDGQLQLVKKYRGFQESSRVLSFDSNGTLWIAHGYKGVFKINFDQAFSKLVSINFYNSKNGLPADQLVGLEHIRNELIFPARYGVYRYHQASDNFRKDEELSSYFHEYEHIIDMEEDIQGSIYFISDERVGKISFDKFGKPLMDDRLFNNIRSRLNDDLQYIRVLDLNNILFGAKDGFIHYNAAKGKAMSGFRTHLTKVINTSQESDSLLLAEHKIAETANLTLPYKLNSLRFIYSSSFFESPEKTQYQYYLENFDKNWSEWTEKTEKEYTNLSEGKYTFHVRARNIYGTVSEAKGFNFVVEPPFYRSRWAFAAYIMAGFFMLGTFFYQVDKRFKREKNQIILAQERKLNQKETEARLATELSEQEINRLRNEKQQSEIDHMNRELTSSTIHLINKNEVLNNVKLELQGMLKEGELNKHSDELRKIIKNIEQNITSDADWNQFELHFNHVHGDFTNRLQERYPDMTPQEIKLSTYLRLNLTTKEIAQLLSISVRGVEISRYRLRKRLGLDRSDNLTDFILKF
ncbi:triple tyrosine motif-containing protein [Pontibacter rugosus]